MDELRIAVVGIGATGAVLAAALLDQYPDTMLVEPKPGVREAMLKAGIGISGEVSYKVPVRNFSDRIGMMKDFRPNLVFVSTKTFHLPKVLEELKEVVTDDTKIAMTNMVKAIEDAYLMEQVR
ncbi:MAG: 2-dehydropantoate 2-reductase N-terminal domain-containing protein [Pseudomonadota bacterium]